MTSVLRESGDLDEHGKTVAKVFDLLSKDKGKVHVDDTFTSFFLHFSELRLLSRDFFG